MFEITLYNQEVQTVNDTYRTLPRLTDFDQHLFNAGNHYNIYVLVYWLKKLSL